MQILRINLNKEVCKFEEISENSKYFLLGGRALTSQIVHDEVPPKCDPLGPENKLIIACGLLTGTPFPNSGRTSVGAKSPLTNGIKEANAGGRCAMMLAMRGIRAIVLEGIASELKLIHIGDNGIKILSALEYAKMGNYELSEKLYERFGNKIGIYSIGPAGEYLMKAASVAVNDLQGYPSRHAARGGMGAVMGSKKVKAIIIEPSKTSKVKIKYIKKFREISKPFALSLAKREGFSTYGTPMMMKPMSEYGGIPTKGFRMGSFDKIDDISGEALHEFVVKRGGKKRLACCPTCAIKCSNLVVDDKGNHITSSLEYETMALNGTNLMINDLESLAWIDHYCDDIGIDTIEFGGTVGVAMDCGKLKWGDAKSVIDLLDKEIRNNTDIGKLYGNGVKNIGEILNAKRIPQVKGQGLPAYDPRVFKGMGVTFATSPMGADHTSGAAIAGRSARADKDYGALTEDEGKYELSYELQLYIGVWDSMGCCYFIGPSYENMEICADAINALLGTNLSRNDVINISKNMLRNELEFNEKAGITNDDNDVPEFFRNEPCPPTNLTYTFPKEDLKNFWKRLDASNP
ncbi:MAG: aldehyde ferredoxin oxidoreductase C-terminal domain-containing protein [Promethearchaeota archaeon]